MFVTIYFATMNIKAFNGLPKRLKYLPVLHLFVIFSSAIMSTAGASLLCLFTLVLLGKGKAGLNHGPLDLNSEVAGSLNTLSSLVGTLGHSSSGLVMGLAGVSITDCAGRLDGQDLNHMTCEQFLDALSECDSMANVKPLLQQAKKNYRKRPNKKSPCFKNKGKKGHHH